MVSSRPKSGLLQNLVIAVWSGVCSICAKRPDKNAGNREMDNSVQALRRTKQQAEMVLENMADGVIAVDAGCNITLFNKAAERLFGAKPDLVMGRKLEEADLHPQVARVAADCVTSGSPCQTEIRLPGFPEKVIGIRAEPFQDGNAGADAAMIMLHDLSEIRRHEKNQKEFVSNVSHELRTPITSIKVTAETLLSGAKNDEAVAGKFLNTIVSESDRLSALINDLMEIARRDSGITKTKKIEVNVAEMVDRAITSVLPQAQQNQVAIETEVAKDLIGHADATQMVQLIRNLVDNAVKYTPSGGSVWISARDVDGKLVISVKDTGIGIPQGELDRIFERFYRVDKARSRRLGGTGLGLAIIKDIVEAHGGDIAVETALGKGSTFTIRLPQQNNSELES